MSGDNEKQRRALEALASLKDVPVAAPDFLETRVMAELDGGGEPKGWRRGWRGVAALVTSAALVLVIGISVTLNSPRVFKATVGQATALNIQIPDVASVAGADRVEIVLPEGTAFFNEETKTAEEKRELSLTLEMTPESSPGGALLGNAKLQWSPAGKDGAVSFTVVAREAGPKKFLVRLLRKDGTVAREEARTLHFVNLPKY